MIVDPNCAHRDIERGDEFTPDRCRDCYAQVYPAHLVAVANSPWGLPPVNAESQEIVDKLLHDNLQTVTRKSVLKSRAVNELCTEVELLSSEVKLLRKLGLEAASIAMRPEVSLSNVRRAERILAKIVRLRAERPLLVHVDRDGESLCAMEVHEGTVPLTKERGKVTCSGCQILSAVERDEALHEAARLRKAAEECLTLLEAVEEGEPWARKSLSANLPRLRNEIERKP